MGMNLSPFSVVSNTISGAKNIAFNGFQVTNEDYNVGIALQICELCNIRFQYLVSRGNVTEGDTTLENVDYEKIITNAENFLFGY